MGFDYKDMNKFFVPLICMMATIASYAQNNQQYINMAKSMGYSDAEIQQMIESKGKRIDNTTTMPNVVVDTSSLRQQVDNEEYTRPTVTVQENANKENTIYGHDFFNNPSLTFVPSNNAPTPTGYILGAGDEINIDVWGNASMSYVLSIGPEGDINIPNIGPVYLSGQTIENAEVFLKNKMGQIYSGLVEDEPNTFLKLSLGKMRSISVNIVGDAAAPGTYILPSMTTLCGAMYNAHGVNKIGTVRSIKVYRNSKLAADFDVYKMIFEGNTSKNIQLKDNDIITISPYGNVVTIQGSVKRPMRYEMIENQSVSDLIEYAGGFSDIAYTDKLNITRKKGEMITSYTIGKDEYDDFKLMDGDVVMVASNINRFKNKVSIRGAVFFPGDYAISDTIRKLSNLINAAGGLLENAYLKEAYITRLDDEWQPTIQTFNLKDVVNGKNDINLKRYDNVTIKSIDELYVDNVVTISGAVNSPLQTNFAQGMTLRTLLLMADGLNDKAYKKESYINRIDENSDKVVINVDLAKLLSDNGYDIPLKAYDAVYIKSIDEIYETQYVTITGYVNNPGQTTYRKGMTVSTLILAANGVKEGAALYNINVNRRIINKLLKHKPDTTSVNYQLDILNNKKDRDFVLQPYDIVSVRKMAAYQEQIVVKVNGEVNYPGAYVIESNKVKLADLIVKCGGLTQDAYISGAILKRKYTSDEIAKLQSEQEVYVNLMDSTLVEDIVEAKVDSVYNVGINLEKALNKRNNEYNITLNDGDILIIPRKNNTVSVTGAVLFPNTIAYSKSKNLNYYVRNAGGFVDGAAKRKSYVVYMNGEVSTGRWSKIEPGCKIIVPKKEVKENKMTATQWIAMMASTATMTTAIVTLVTLLQRNSK